MPPAATSAAPHPAEAAPPVDAAAAVLVALSPAADWLTHEPSKKKQKKSDNNEKNVREILTFPNLYDFKYVFPLLVVLQSREETVAPLLVLAEGTKAVVEAVAKLAAVGHAMLLLLLLLLDHCHLVQFLDLLLLHLLLLLFVLLLRNDVLLLDVRHHR